MKAQFRIELFANKNSQGYIKSLLTKLHSNANVSLEFNDMNTLVTGEYFEVMKILSDQVFQSHNENGIEDLGMKLHIKFLQE